MSDSDNENNLLRFVKKLFCVWCLCLCAVLYRTPMHSNAQNELHEAQLTLQTNCM